MKETGDEKLVEVWNYPRISLAKVGQYRLGENGIKAEVFGGDVDSYYLTAIGGVSLMVRQVDFELAKKILNSNDEVGDGIVEEKDEISDGALYCSMCHSKDIRIKKIQYLNNDNFFVNYLKWCFGYKRVLSCRRCKHVWKTK